MNEFETGSRNRSVIDLYAGTKEFEKGYHPRTSFIKDESGDLFADSHILSRWRNFF
jgi:hypothetical protein